MVKKIEDSPRVVSRLRCAVENCKRGLSGSTSAEIEVDSLVGDFDSCAMLDRAKLEELNAALFKRCIDTVKHVMDDAGCAIDDVREIVLVGDPPASPPCRSCCTICSGGRSSCASRSIPTRPWLGGI